jgi:hypothetical protein
MMLRRPVAVYRVIDEAELLGEDWSEAPEIAAAPPGEPTLLADDPDFIGQGDSWAKATASPARDRRHAAHALLCVGVVALAAAGALTISSAAAPHHAPMLPRASTIASVRPRRRSHATAPRVPAVLPSRSTTRPRRHAVLRPAPRAHHAALAVHRHAAASSPQRPSRSRVAQVAQVASPRAHLSSAVPASPQQEFGFER